MRIGLFGGTFNPIHLGHLRAAVEVREAFNLEKLLLIPSARPPHKDGTDIAEAADRLEMVRAAVQDVPFLEASDVELARSGPSYTIETLRYFQHHFGQASTIYFIVGQDAFSEITTWKLYQQLFATAHFIVMARPGSALKDLSTFIHQHISKDYEYAQRDSRYHHPQWCAIFCLHITHLDISATQIRALIKQGHSIRFLVPERVENYIAKKGLYR